MNLLEAITRKKKLTIIGLMSGTSADGIDAVLIDVSGSGTGTRFIRRAFAMYPYPRGYRKFLLAQSDNASAKLESVTRLNVLVAEFFAEAARKIARKAGKPIAEVDLIGSHGQTIHHLPRPVKLYGRDIHATLQIGSPSVIAKRTGVVTVGDFRSGDIAVGGTGAPLVPYLDYILFRSAKHTRALLNVGGIANITVLPRGCGISEVLAFDTGPGNMLIDGLMERFFGVPLDRDGRTAGRGMIIPRLLRELLEHPFFRIRPPKSTGREAFGRDLMDMILKRTRRVRKEDVITTVSELTALSIFRSCRALPRRTGRIDELLVSGGGVHNVYLMDALRRYFAGVKVRVTDELGCPADAKEAICFALLANETLRGNPSNVPGATGARRQTVLGTICLP